MDQCNIVICTPGRLLQHMDENPLFDCSNMQVLVLDEADRCLDMGFQATMNGIIENLPQTRQTLLYSATQTKSVKDLARLSLVDPMYVAPHEQSEHSTPSSLQQNYIVCKLEDKISMLYSFIRNHLKQKSIVFMASCKQVRYIYDIFCKLRPGTSLLALYGTLHQERREQIYEEFCRKSNVVLFATDIAARGLDFPEVNWVVQLDCPEDTNTYIHRAGRTARHVHRGESLLVLLPNEEEMMIELLNNCKIPINKIKIDPMKLQTPQRKIEALLAQYPNLKDTAQRAFVSYVKSVFLMKNKKVFNVHELNTDAFANSLGLVVPPRIRFLQRHKKKTESQVSGKPNQDSDVESEYDEEVSEFNTCAPAAEFSGKHSESEDEENVDNVPKSKIPFDIPDDDSDDGGILTLKRKDHDIETPQKEIDEPIVEKTSKKKTKVITKASIVKKIIKKKIISNKKTVFDEEGDVVINETKDKRSQLAKDYENKDVGGINIEEAKKMLKEEDKFDKARFREQKKAKNRANKNKLKNKEEEVDDFGSDSDDSGPDISWMPDPDKIYGKENSPHNDEESNDSSILDDYNVCGSSKSNSEPESDISEKFHNPKRKLVAKDNKKVHKKQKLGIGALSQSLSVSEAEQLAMTLLSGK